MLRQVRTGHAKTGLAMLVAIAAAVWLAPTALIRIRERTTPRPVGTYGDSPSIRMALPGEHGFYPQGNSVPLSAAITSAWDLTVNSVTFYVDGKPIPVPSPGRAPRAFWQSAGALNPSEHQVYVTASVTNQQAETLALDSRNPSPGGNGHAIHFAILDLYPNRVEFTDSHPLSYDAADEDSKGAQFTVPTSADDPSSRPQLQVVNGQWQGPYAVCRKMGETTTLKLAVGGNAPLHNNVRVRVSGELARHSSPAWDKTWQATIPAGSADRGGSATTPPLANAIETDTMKLRFRTDYRFADGTWVPVSKTDQFFTVYTDLGPREADPAIDPNDDVLFQSPPQGTSAYFAWLRDHGGGGGGAGGAAFTRRRQWSIRGRAGGRGSTSPGAVGALDGSRRSANGRSKRGLP
jgi:hypothetical protein